MGEEFSYILGRSFPLRKPGSGFIDLTTQGKKSYSSKPEHMIHVHYTSLFIYIDLEAKLDYIWLNARAP